MFEFNIERYRVASAPFTASQPRQEKRMKHQQLIHADEIGPFPGGVKPARPGMYKRITKKGNVVWSYWDAKHGRGQVWGKFSGNYAKAYGLREKTSKHQSLPWIGAKK